jgi:hypothetical protein
MCADAVGDEHIPLGRCRRFAALLAGCAVLFGFQALAAVPGAPSLTQPGPEPRSTVVRMAELIEENYFDAAQGRAIADSLRAAAQAGEFDALTLPRDLATALTALLHPLDHHFRIVLSNAPNGRWSDNTASGLPDASAAERRSAYGFRRVEMLPGAIGYIDLQSLAYLASSKRDDPARTAANAALQLVHEADAIIIDLRDNVGGSSDMAAYLVSAFTPPGADVYDVIHWRNGTDSERPALPYPRPRVDLPLYLLISARTASAAEAAAYTLRASGRAVIVGETSAVAANVGGVFPVDEHLGVFIPIGSPVNPVTGSNWEGKGIVPDVAIAAEAALPCAEQLALARVLERDPHGAQAAYTSDALEALRAEASPRPGPPLGGYAGIYSGTVVTVAGDLLALRQGNRMPSTLVRLIGDTFFDRNDPSRRIVFERGAYGAITGLRVTYPSGYEQWFPARPLPLPALQLRKP